MHTNNETRARRTGRRPRFARHALAYHIIGFSLVDVIYVHGNSSNKIITLLHIK